MRCLPIVLVALGIAPRALAQEPGTPADPQVTPFPAVDPLVTPAPVAPSTDTANQAAMPSRAAAVPEVAPPPAAVPEVAPPPAQPAWLGNSYAELGAALRAFQERLVEAGDCEPPAPPEPVGVTADSVNGALAGIAARIAPAEPPEPVPEPEATPEEPPLAIPGEPPPEPDLRARWRYEQHTLFGVTRRSGRVGAHLGLTANASRFDGVDSGGWGLEGAFVLGGSVVLGGALYATSLVDLGDKGVATFAYGGFQPGLILWTEAVVHPRIDVLLGGGAAFDIYTGAVLGESPVLVPRLGLELNVSRAIRASGNLGWRFVGSRDADTSEFSSFELGVSLRLGWM